MAGQGKDKRRDDAAKKDDAAKRDDATRDTGKDAGKKDETTALLRRLIEQMTTLRADVDGIKAGSPVAESGKSKKASSPVEGTGDGETPPIDDAEVARLGYAFSSPQKVSLIRLLLTGGEQSAAQLGEQANLTTGSLYHHLRELIHADVLVQETRNRYALSDRGRRAALALASLAGE